MTTETPTGGEPGKEARETPLPPWRRVGEFVLNLLKLEGAVESLKAENKELDARIKDLQKLVYEQNGQIRILTEFVTKALDDQVRVRAEEAAVRAFERMASFSGFRPERAAGEEKE